MKFLVLTAALLGTSLAFDCTNDGMFVDPVDCSVFHRCVGGRDYPGKVCEQPIRTRYLGHVTGYQPIRNLCENRKTIERVPRLGYTQSLLSFQANALTTVLAGQANALTVTDPKKRANFVSHVTKFIKEHNFDGLDLDWEYPKCWQANCYAGPRSDKPNFVKLCQELKAAFKPHGYLLSAAVAASKWTIADAYDMKGIGEALDFINVMTYDLHGIWDKKTGHHSQLKGHKSDSHKFLNSHYAPH
eukprot:sb/3468959/